MRYASSLLPERSADPETIIFVDELFEEGFLDQLLGAYGLRFPSPRAEQKGRVLMDHSLRSTLKGVLSALGRDYINKRVLELGCGCNGNNVESSVYGKYAYQPWLCRALHKIGVNVAGIDVGYLSEERFEHYEIDLLVPESLAFIPDDSIDVVYELSLFTSPELEKRVNGGVRVGNCSVKATETLRAVLVP